MDTEGNQNLDADAASWHATKRWQQLDGEYRANYLRIISLACFYSVHLLHYYQPLGFLQFGAPPSKEFHQAVTFLAAAWILVALMTDRCLRNRIFPRWFPYLTSGLDIAFLTAMICIRTGLQSPLIVAYPLVLILVALRFDLVLLRISTAAAAFGYLFVCTVSRWPQLLGGRQIGRAPRYEQLITLFAIVLCGIMLGQFIRRFRTMANWYATHRENSEARQS